MLSTIHSVTARYQTSALGSAAVGMPASAAARHRLENTPRMTAKNTDAAVHVAALAARARDGDARKRHVLRHQARHDVTLPGSALAYRARMTSSSGASSMAMSLIAA